MRLPAALLLAVALVPAAGALPLDDARQDLGPVGPIYPYHTWETLSLELRDLVGAHPDIARLHSAGKSHLGFDLWVVEIADFMNPGRLPLERREVVWLDGGTHANEQLGMMLAYLWVKFLLTEYEGNETAKWIVENRHTYVLPMVNPDGNHFDGRFNGRGVNINRNYPSGWGQVDENPLFNNPGPYAMSEPETRAVVGFVKAVRPDYFNSFHTGVDMMLYPVGYAEVPAKDDAVFARICRELGETDPAFCGPVYSTIYPASGIAVDTAYFETGAIAWTYEVSEEGFLYASLDDPRIRLDRYWKGVEHAFLNVEKYGAHLALRSLRLLDAGAGPFTVEAVVENDGYGPAPWARLSVGFAGAQVAEQVLGEVPSGASRSLRFTLPREGAPEPSGLAFEVQHPKRLETSPMAHLVNIVPVLAQGGRLTAEVVPALPSPLSATASQGVPGPEVLAVLGVLGAVALAARRR